MLQNVLGWRPNPVNTFATLRATRFAAGQRRAGVQPLETCSLLQFAPRRLYQGYVGSCVSVGTKGMFLDWCAANGEEPFEASERVLYWQSRVLEYRYQGDSPEEIADLVAAAGDTGAYPWLAFRAWADQGIVPFEACPDTEPTTPDEIERFVEKQPPPAAFMQGYRNRNLETIGVEGVGLDKVRQMVELLRLRVPVGFGMTVDLAFMQNAGQAIEGVNHSLAQGGHWMRVLAVLNEGAELVWNNDASPEEVTELLRVHELEDPRQVMSSSLVLFHNTWRGWGLPNGMGMIRVGAWASESRDVTGVSWLPV